MGFMDSDWARIIDPGGFLSSGGEAPKQKAAVLDENTAGAMQRLRNVHAMERTPEEWAHRAVDQYRDVQAQDIGKRGLERVMGASGNPMGHAIQNRMAKQYDYDINRKQRQASNEGMVRHFQATQKRAGMEAVNNRIAADRALTDYQNQIGQIQVRNAVINNAVGTASQVFGMVMGARGLSATPSSPSASSTAGAEGGSGMRNNRIPPPQ